MRLEYLRSTKALLWAFSLNRPVCRKYMLAVFLDMVIDYE